MSEGEEKMIKGQIEFNLYSFLRNNTLLGLVGVLFERDEKSRCTR